MQLAALERELGVQLTERQGRILALTPAGRLLARHGHDVVDRLALAELEVAALREGSVGSYRLAAFSSIARTVVADTWRTILEAPEHGLTLSLTELEPTDSLSALAAGEVELTLTHAYSNMPEFGVAGLDGVRIASEPVWLAMRADDPALAGRSTDAVPADLRAFARHDWVVPHRRWSCYEMVERACGLAGFAPRTVAEATDFAVILSLVAAGVGVALVPHLTVAAVPDGVVLVPLAQPVFRHDFAVTRSTSAADAGLRRLRELLTASAARLVPAASPATAPVT
jgi:DNA-binding transcriptional LysR family regulator